MAVVQPAAGRRESKELLQERLCPAVTRNREAYLHLTDGPHRAPSISIICLDAQTYPFYSLSIKKQRRNKKGHALYFDYVTGRGGALVAHAGVLFEKRKEPMKKILALAYLGIAMAATGAMAGTKPIQLSLTPDIAVYDRSTTIKGLSLSIWGENPQASLALGIVNGATGQSAGFSLGLLLNYADGYKGVQAAPVNYTTRNFLGWQLGFMDYTEGSVKGLQTGLVNYAGHLTGVQLGIVNFAAAAKTGVQIGILNLLPQNSWFTRFPNELASGMVFVNWRF
jgi:hypothetical protein